MNESGERTPLGTPRAVSRLREHARFVLLLCVGLALPFYAFPVARLSGREIDLATVLAGMFIVASLPELLGERFARAALVLCAGAVLIPLLALIPPRASPFRLAAFANSYAHWLVVVGFFLSATTLRLTGDQQRRLCVGQVVVGFAVASFAFYQVFGMTRGWPATGAVLVSFQREPFRFDRTLGYVRPTSVFLEPAWMGGYLVWVFALSCALLSMARRHWRFVVLVTSAALLAAILASVSWGAYFDLFIVGAVMSATALKCRLVSARFAAGAAAILALVLVAGALSSEGRHVVDAARRRWIRMTTTSLEETKPEERPVDSTRLRFQEAGHAARLARAYPLRGVGLGQYSAHAPAKGDARAGDFQDPWCGWLAIAAEAGAGGPLLLAGALLLVVRSRRRCFRTAGLLLAVPALVAFCAVAQIHTGSYIDLWWWYPLSLAAALGAEPKEASKSGIF
jgi:hypothetical protein